jgi:hypothetical protein
MSAAWVVAYVVLGVLVVLVAVLVLGTLRRISTVLERAELALTSSTGRPGGLEPGAIVPDFEAATSSGRTFTAATLEARSSLVVLVDRDCPPCRRLLDELAQEQPEDLPDLFVVFGDRGMQNGSPEVAPATAVLAQVNGSVSRAFDSGSTPHTFALHGRRVVAAGTPNTVEGLRHLALRLREEVRNKPNRKLLRA